MNWNWVSTVTLTAALAVGAAILPAQAANWMTEAELKAVFGGRTIEGAYANGTKFVESYAARGTLDYSEPRRKLTGRWSTVGDTFCTIYDGDQTGGCFRVRQVSDNCYEFFFAARDEAEAESAPARKPSWTARASRTDAAPTCRAVPTV